jgi:hypothetical protein
MSVPDGPFAALDTRPVYQHRNTMLSCSSCVDKFVPQEYRKAAEAFFPAEDTSKGPDKRTVLKFADALGVGTNFRKLDASWENAPELKKYLLSFQNNLDLLIRKTWVEKGDEDRKEGLLNRLPPFIALIEKGNYIKALGEFGGILEELAWLLFGTQSRKEDFIEYAFRIDGQMGLFWWYSGKLGHFLASVLPPDPAGNLSSQAHSAAKSADTETLRAILLLGICYLTDF